MYKSIVSIFLSFLLKSSIVKLQTYFSGKSQTILKGEFNVMSNVADTEESVNKNIYNKESLSLSFSL